jgi:hypothetical protein
MRPAHRHRERSTERDNHRGREARSMPAPDAGHGAARLKLTPSPRFTQPDPPVPPPSRRKSSPPDSQLPGFSRSTRPRNPRQTPCRRQIPIDPTGRTVEPNPPAVSSPEACPTPADQARRRHPVTAGVRQPLTPSDLPSLAQNVGSWGISGPQFWAAGGLFIARRRHYTKCAQAALTYHICQLRGLTNQRWGSLPG